MTKQDILNLINTSDKLENFLGDLTNAICHISIQCDDSYDDELRNRMRMIHYHIATAYNIQRNRDGN